VLLFHSNPDNKVAQRARIFLRRSFVRACCAKCLHFGNARVIGVRESPDELSINGV
jgi:hypothetical protein